MNGILDLKCVNSRKLIFRSRLRKVNLFWLNQNVESFFGMEKLSGCPKALRKERFKGTESPTRIGAAVSMNG